MKKEKNAQVSAPLVCTPLFPGVAEVIPAPVEFRVGTEIDGVDQIDLGRPVAPLLTITDDELELARLGLGRVNARPFGTPVVQYAPADQLIASLNPSVLRAADAIGQGDRVRAAVVTVAEKCREFLTVREQHGRLLEAENYIEGAVVEEALLLEGLVLLAGRPPLRGQLQRPLGIGELEVSASRNDVGNWSVNLHAYCRRTPTTTHMTFIPLLSYGELPEWLEQVLSEGASMNDGEVCDDRR